MILHISILSLKKLWKVGQVSLKIFKLNIKKTFTYIYNNYTFFNLRKDHAFFKLLKIVYSNLYVVD